VPLHVENTKKGSQTVSRFHEKRVMASDIQQMAAANAQGDGGFRQVGQANQMRTLRLQANRRMW
jgi:hypothetical protein